MGKEFVVDNEKSLGEDAELGLRHVNTTDVGEMENSGSLQRGLKSRHAQMIALGGTIGTGLFVGSGQALVMGGPLFLLLAYILISALVYGVAMALVEVCAYLPVTGCSVPYYANRFVSPSLSFALGWLFWYIFCITVPAEMTATGLVIGYWNPGVNVGVWITLSGVVIIALNFLPVKFYGECEFWFAGLKVITTIGLIFLTVVLFFGGGPSHEPLWFTNWGKPGPVNEYMVSGDAGRLCAFVSTVCFSVFAFAFAPELLVQTGGEMQNPRVNLPIAGKRYFYRLIIFYVLGALCIGIIVSSANPDLLGGGSGAASSPWALGIKDAGIYVLDSIINAAILISAWSAGNSYLYMSSRILYSMAVSGNAPKIFTKCSKSGIPYWAVLASCLWAPLAYLNVSSSGSEVFNWFVNLINCGGYESWICCCIIYIRFRKAAAAQGITEVPFRSVMQPYAAWFSLTMFSLLLLLSGYAVFIDGNWDTPSFITSYIGIPILLGIYLAHKFTRGRNDEWLIAPHKVDLHSDLDEILALEKPLTKTSEPWYMLWKRIYT